MNTGTTQEKIIGMLQNFCHLRMVVNRRNSNIIHAHVNS